MEIRHFYHLYLDGDAPWSVIADEYADVLRLAGFPVDPVIGLVGKDRESARHWAADRQWIVGAEADTGFEQVTLAVLQGELAHMPDDTAVLYTHSKGAMRNMIAEDQWRRSMLWHLVFGWQHCVELLQTHDVAGCHWRHDNHFAGNFWWARAGFLRTLPPVNAADADRYSAELWLGSGRPERVANLVEGFPPDGTRDGAILLSEQLPRKFTRQRRIWPRR